MSPSSNSLLMLCAVSVLLPASAAIAADANRAADIHQQYLRDRADCQQITAADARKTCLREAGAAQHEARRGALAEKQADYDKNRFARCGVYKDPQERDYCMRRMRGEGTTSGSVKEGAIVRSLVVTVPATQ